MKSVDVSRCIELGVSADRFTDETRSITLALPEITWSLIETMARADDVPADLYIRHLLDRWAVDSLKSSLTLHEAMSRVAGEEATQFGGKKLYFMRRGGDGAIKIGVSADVERRVRGVQTGSDERVTVLLAVDQSADLNEPLLHRQFAQHRKNGEWFEPCEELLTLIDRLSERA